MKKLVVVMVALVTCVALAAGEKGGSGARRGFHGRKGMGEGFAGDPIVRLALSPKAAERLNLTAEQQAKLAELRGDRASTKAEREKLAAAMARQVELMKAEKIDESAVMASVDEVFELRKAMAKDQMKRAIAVRAVLTPEQVAQLKEGMKAQLEKARAHRLEKAGRGKRGQGKAEEQ